MNTCVAATVFLADICSHKKWMEMNEYICELSVKILKHTTHTLDFLVTQVKNILREGRKKCLREERKCSSSTRNLYHVCVSIIMY